MSDIRLDPVTGDIDVSTGDLLLTSGTEAIAQNLRIRLRMFLGEWFLDTRQGIPYFRNILIKNPRTNVVRSIFRQAILTTPGVTGLDKLVLDFDNSLRQLDVSFDAVTDTGEILTFDEVFIIEV